MNKETFDSLWQYCCEHNRVIPKDWNKLYSLLKNKKQKSTGGWMPSLPLILAAWYDTSPLEKQFRFKEHIKCAEQQNQLFEIGEYLRELKENEWYHFGEL